MSQRAFIEVLGGSVQHIEAPESLDVQVIDWDMLKENIVPSWERLSVEARQYLARHHVDAYVELVRRYNAAR